MSTILDRAKASNQICFDADYRRGSLLDRSPNAAAATVSGTVNWVRTKLGYALSFGSGTGYISYAHNAALSLDSTAFTLIALGRVENQGNVRVISKRSAAQYGPELFVTPVSLGVFDGTNIASATKALHATTMMAVTLSAAGATANAYVNGVLVGPLNKTTTIPASTVPLLIGNIYSGGQPCTFPLNRVTILNRALTPQDIAQLYQELTQERFPLRAYSFGSRIEAPKDPPGAQALLKTDFTTRLPDGRLADLSGNGWHGTVKPGFVAAQGMCGNSLVANSASRTYVDFGDVTPINGASKLTVLWYGKFNDRAATSVLLGKDADNSTGRLDLNINSSGNIILNAATKLGYTANTMTGLPLFWSTVYDGSLAAASKVKMTLDNAPQTMTVSSDFGATLPNNTGTSLRYGDINYTSGSYAPAQEGQYLALYTSALTPEQIGYVYRQIARRQTFRLDLSRVPVSLANMVGPCEVPNTPIRITNGTWQVYENSAGQHYFASVSSTLPKASFRSSQAYGTWIFDSIFTSSPSGMVAFLNAIDDGWGATRGGYCLYFSGTSLALIRIDAAGGTGTLWSNSNILAQNTRYMFAITRDASGVFKCYIKGGAYNTWTLIPVTAGANPATSATYTTSNYFCLSPWTNALQGMSFCDFHQGVLSLQDLKEVA